MAVNPKTFGRFNLAATTNTSVYTGAGASSKAVLNVRLTNRNVSASVLVRVAVSDTGTPTDADYLEYNAYIAPGRPLVNTGINVDGTKRVVVYSSLANVSCVVDGVEVV